MDRDVEGLATECLDGHKLGKARLRDLRQLKSTGLKRMLSNLCPSRVGKRIAVVCTRTSPNLCRAGGIGVEVEASNFNVGQGLNVKHKAVSDVAGRAKVRRDRKRSLEAIVRAADGIFALLTTSISTAVGNRRKDTSFSRVASIRSTIVPVITCDRVVGTDPVVARVVGTCVVVITYRSSVKTGRVRQGYITTASFRPQG